jgi:hypothetical protein
VKTGDSWISVSLDLCLMKGEEWLLWKQRLMMREEEEELKMRQ